MIICLSGYAGSGKDTFAKLLAPEFKRIAIADKIRDLVYELNTNMFTVDSGKHGWTHTTRQLVDQFGWEAAKRDYPELRAELWETGKAAKRAFGETFWLGEMFAATSYDAAGEFIYEPNYVVTDIRFKYEIDYIKSREGSDVKVINIVRPEIGASTTHEADMEGYEFDYTISNEGSIEDLRKYAVLLKVFAAK